LGNSENGQRGKWETEELGNGKCIIERGNFHVTADKTAIHKPEKPENFAQFSVALISVA